MTTATIDHPSHHGFTPRFEWHGTERVIVWRHCGNDARYGNITHQENRRVDHHYIVACVVCDARYESECLWRKVGASA